MVAFFCLIQAEIAACISNWRTVTADVELQQKMIERLSFFMAGSAKGVLREWYEANISLCGPKGRGRVPRPWAGRCDQPLFYVPPKTDREAAGNDFVVPLIFSNVFHLIHP